MPASPSTAFTSTASATALEPLLLIPGPTPLPASVREALSGPAIGHRSPEFKAILKRVFPKLQWAFKTTQPVLLYTASGTGAMEAALVNVLNPGDQILVLCCGVFSERWAEIAEKLGIQAERLSVPYGQPNTLESLKARLAADSQKHIKAVCFIHSETSTGVLNPVADLTSIIREHGALAIVDTVTGLGSAPFAFDDWGLDIAVSGSQKGFMIPPGLSFLALSDRALAAHKACKNPGYYFNFSKYLKSQAEDTTPYTPSTCLIQALDASLSLMEAEGLAQVNQRHRRMRDMIRSGVRAMGLQLLVEDDACASDAVTSILPPPGIAVGDIRNGLKKDFGITVAAGQKTLQDQIFRIGHLGHVTENDMQRVLTALSSVLQTLGYGQGPSAL